MVRVEMPSIDETGSQNEKQIPLLAMRNVSKNFGNLVAVREVDFEVHAGEIVALVGDNGAGKSTLLKLMNGFHSPNRGELQFEGKRVTFSSPKDARALGIETVYQDLALVSGLSLWRNFFLGREETKRLGPIKVLDQRMMAKTTMGVLQEMGLTRLRSSDEPVEILSGGERQALAIARAYFFGGKLLVLDEPTAALSVKQTEHVRDAISAARAKGAGIVVIDHNIAHVHGIADRIVVLQNGSVLGSFAQAEIDPNTLMSMLAGRHSLSQSPASA